MTIAEIVMITMMKKLTIATLFLRSRLKPSLKAVVDGRILTMYSLSFSLAGRKSSTLTCALRRFRFSLSIT